MTKAYVGTKIIQAEPADNAEGVPGYNVYYPPARGNAPVYKSWSPKDVFEACYRELLEGETCMVKES